MAAEIELKLQVRPEDLPALRASPLLGARARDRRQRLETVYFDTDDLAFRRHGASLRVRRLRRRCVQTLKTAPSHLGGAFERGEWEAPVPGLAPDLRVLEDGVLPLRLAGNGPLRPVFETHITRVVRRIDGPAAGAVVEVAFDEGEIRSVAGAALPVAEIELELKAGEPERLFDLALALQLAAPVRIETRSKSDRGYALVAGADRAAIHAAPLQLPPDCTIAAAIVAIGRHCLDHLARNEPVFLETNGAGAVHQMRVALRRLRSALSIFRRLLPAEPLADLAAEVRWLAGELAPARAWDVFLADLLAPVEAGFAPNTELAALAAAARQHHDAAYARARAAVLSPRYTALLLTIGKWLASNALRPEAGDARQEMLMQPMVDAADRLLAKRRKRALRRGRDLANLPVEGRHELRIALKRLRYAAEFFRSFHGEKPARRYMKRLIAPLDSLGHLNDVATARRLLDELRAADPEASFDGAIGRVMGWHCRGLHDLEPTLLEQWESFREAKPFWSAGKGS